MAYQHMTHETFEDCHQTCVALEALVKKGVVKMVPTPNAGNLWDIGYVAAERYEEAMKERLGRIILAGPKEVIDYGKQA